MGFELLNKEGKYAYQLLGKELSMPQEGKEIDIEINLYPNSREWITKTLPSKTIFQKGALVNRVVYLSERVCIPEFRELWGGDVVVEILINGSTVYADKAKRKEAEELGVEYQQNGFAIERLNLIDQGGL